MKHRAVRGVTLVETMAALALLAIGILMSSSVVLWADQVESRAANRADALDLASGVAEQLRAQPYADVLSGEADLSGEILPQNLQGLRVTQTVEENEENRSKEVLIQVEWGGNHAGTVSLRMVVGDAELYR